MMRDKLVEFMKKRHCTLLGAGPMSLACIDAAIELANEYDLPVMLVASRRQIDSEEFGGGYVNNWTTGQFADYVLGKDKKGKVFLARDHGGPWQNPHEQRQNLGLRLAMESAKRSYRADIAAGFQILHLDPSVDIHARPGRDEILDRLFELYEFCWAEARDRGQDILFEVGTEEQSGGVESLEDLHHIVQAVQKFCAKHRFPLPVFMVMQTGTKILETRNVGVFDVPLRVCGEVPAEIQIPKMLEICGQYDLMLKEHNADYLSDDTLRWHPYLGIHAANVAPEFGVAETRALLALLRRNGLTALADAFLELAYASRKWAKWLAPDSAATREDMAVMAGHYTFSSPGCVELKEKARAELAPKGIALENELKLAVKRSIFRYLRHFNKMPGTGLSA
jgi:hypothetical protein